ncbi:putative methionyl-tRNA synthetase [Hordeum vulgare]|nr:putative methionyl-tRNA synthetase [Hordeum vulgare]
MYWGRIKTAFNERKLVDPDFVDIHMDRIKKAMENRRLMIQAACNKFLHVFSRIKSCEKWREVRLALHKAKESYNSDMPAPPTAEGRPYGTKKARTMKDAAPAAALPQALIEQCIADAKRSTAKREEKLDTRWSTLMANEHVKLDLLRTNVVATKRNTDLAFLMGAD